MKKIKCEDGKNSQPDIDPGQNVNDTPAFISLRENKNEFLFFSYNCPSLSQ